VTGGRPGSGHVAVAAAIALVGVACGDPAPVVHEGPVPPTLPVVAGGAAEVNLDVPGGSMVTATFATAAAVDWDIHVHRGDRIEIRDQGTAATGTLTIAPADAGSAYSLLWQNRSDDDLRLDLTLTLAGGASVISWSTR
jgi:hypothetical protein